MRTSITDLPGMRYPLVQAGGPGIVRAAEPAARQMDGLQSARAELNGKTA